ncbi:MAG TPA: hypothetical protein VG389_19845 [Myxococcota bacterium]|jgi:outer membrane protein OmpA-like peptidoglycan-associated protein|nr:hypothetical protein [Myxococcota bacterium]
MAKVHTLEIYAHVERSCPGCFEATEQEAPDPGDDAANSAGTGGGAAGAAAPAEGPGTAAAADEAPLGDAHLIEVRVLNASGVPEPRVAYDARLPDGTTRSGATTADGYIRLSVTPQTGAFRLKLPDHEPPAGARPPPPPAAAGAVAYARDGLDLTIGTPAVVQLPPRVFRGRLTGILFDHGAFLPPSSLPALKEMKRLYDAHPGLAVLVVGHSDTAGDDDPNLQISVERAEAVAAFLKDDFAAWLPWYERSKPAAKRWGTREDQHMLSAVKDGAAPFYASAVNGSEDAGTRDAVRRFQTWANAHAGAGLHVDGDAGENTRRALIKAYMELDDTTLPHGTTLLTHGCGEFHPEIPTADGVNEPRNRRVEIFLFEGPVDPPPGRCARPGCPEHQEWVRRTVETFDFGSPDLTARDEIGAIHVRVHGRRSLSPLGGKPYTLVLADEERTGETSADGVIRLAGVPIGFYPVDVEGRFGFVEARRLEGSEVPSAVWLRETDGELLPAAAAASEADTPGAPVAPAAPAPLTDEELDDDAQALGNDFDDEAAPDVAPAAPLSPTGAWEDYVGRPSVPDDLVEQIRAARAAVPVVAALTEVRRAGESKGHVYMGDDSAHKAFVREYLESKAGAASGVDVKKIRAFLAFQGREGGSSAINSWDGQVVTWGTGFGGGGGLGAVMGRATAASPALVQLFHDCGFRYSGSGGDNHFDVVDLDAKKVVSGGKDTALKIVRGRQSTRPPTYKLELLYMLIKAAQDPATREAVVQAQLDTFTAPTGSASFGGASAIQTQALFNFVTHLKHWLPAYASGIMGWVTPRGGGSDASMAHLCSQYFFGKAIKAGKDSDWVSASWHQHMRHYDHLRADGLDVANPAGPPSAAPAGV